MEYSIKAVDFNFKNIKGVKAERSETLVHVGHVDDGALNSFGCRPHL